MYVNSKNIISGITAINSNDDLDDYNTIGVFTCDSSSKAQSLSHCPVNTGFKLIVMQTGYGSIAYGLQIIMIGSGATYPRVFIRSKNGVDSTAPWTSWYVMNMSAAS